MKAVSRWVYILLLISTFFISRGAIAKEGSIDCDNRFVTLANPVRGRNLWIDKTVRPLKNQYDLIKQYGVPVTWLLQYDVLLDKELLDEIGKFDKNQERGVLLEVSENYANAARVIYPYSVPWFSPNAVFLSGYPQSDRRKLIDKLFEEFKSKFGYYPKSVGAWWIDSYSLNYMKEKYGVKSAMIVADQKTTDNYGVWGQWWGVPYYPSKANILTPASSLNNKLDVVIIQWAQRDPLFSLGDGPKYSNYSLQANDYIRQGKDTEYFKQMVNIYLNCKNPIGQVTVGLETGIESIGYIQEYQNQLIALKEIENLQFVTMNEMATRFAKVYPSFPEEAEVDGDSVWKMTISNRVNEKFGEQINYASEIAFSDYFVADNGNFLDRKLQDNNLQKNIFWFPWFIAASLGLLFFSYQKKLIKVWGVSMLFALAAFGLILRSYYQTGWKIYLGPELPYLEIFQIVSILGAFSLIWLLNKWVIIRKNLWLLPLIFGVDFLIRATRVSYISDRYYIGFAVDALRFIGFSIKPVTDIKFINQDFPSFISNAFLRINFNRLWDNPILALILYPFGHIVVAILLGLLLMRLSIRVQKLVIVALIILFLLYLSSIFQADPRQVSPILLQ